MNKKKAAQTIRACLNELYLAADPPISWEEIEKKYADVDEWWMNHYIKREDYDRIKAKYQKKLPKVYHWSLSMELLNYAPTEVKHETVDG